MSEVLTYGTCRSSSLSEVTWSILPQIAGLPFLLRLQFSGKPKVPPWNLALWQKGHIDESSEVSKELMKARLGSKYRVVSIISNWEWDRVWSHDNWAAVVTRNHSKQVKLNAVRRISVSAQTLKVHYNNNWNCDITRFVSAPQRWPLRRASTQCYYKITNASTRDSIELRL